jgi:hypothetical protein
VGDTGLEPVSVTPGVANELRNSPNSSGAKSDASGAQSAISRTADPDLAKVIRRWPDLPESVKAGILAMVRAAGGDGTHAQ